MPSRADVFFEEQRDSQITFSSLGFKSILIEIIENQVRINVHLHNRKQLIFHVHFLLCSPWCITED